MACEWQPMCSGEAPTSPRRTNIFTFSPAYDGRFMGNNPKKSSVFLGTMNSSLMKSPCPWRSEHNQGFKNSNGAGVGGKYNFTQKKTLLVFLLRVEKWPSEWWILKLHVLCQTFAILIKSDLKISNDLGSQSWSRDELGLLPSSRSLLNFEHSEISPPQENWFTRPCFHLCLGFCHFTFLSSFWSHPVETPRSIFGR